MSEDVKKRILVLSLSVLYSLMLHPNKSQFHFFLSIKSQMCNNFNIIYILINYSYFYHEFLKQNHATTYFYFVKVYFS